MPLPIDLSLLALASLCLGTVLAVGLGQAAASAIVALFGSREEGRAADSQA